MRQRVATIGMFDGVHLGHRLIIDELKKIAGKTNCDTAIFTFNNHPLSIVRPEIAPLLLTPGEEKKQLLECCGLNNIVISQFNNGMRQMSAREFMLDLRDKHRVTTLLMGFNNRFGNDKGFTFANYRELGDNIGINIIKSPELRHNGHAVNSTAIRDALNTGNITLANEMLGRHYTVSGKVVKGNQIGRTIGFPTANIESSSESKLIPRPGVYAGTATLATGELFPAMINIGSRPTVNNNAAGITIEAHIANMNKNLYGSVITLSFIKLMRQECRFNSLEELKQQLAIDLSETKSIINATLKPLQQC